MRGGIQPRSCDNNPSYRLQHPGAPLFDIFDLPVYTATLENRDSNAKLGSYLDDHEFFTVRKEVTKIIDFITKEMHLMAAFIGEIVFLLLQIQVNLNRNHGHRCFTIINLKSKNPTVSIESA